ncbi:hypothetical protein [Antarcticirhabdus aurantiaca]|uniref:Uncharacterized protein n=1 Tax=Antarcticirhabdus aurantiaca TaxID=2606717 RepID=A0ACD4NVE0_9HYPH|nr:hypothetical protein [Antarcticirhabdus aurantiaca]WAJ30774.1 hypothetical protein OXU80_11470 [Jeongeuplla avenae]
MTAILSGILVAVLVAIAASFGLAEIQEPAYERFATSGTRVGDPGENLVGQRWDGLNDPAQAQAEE